MTRKFALLPFSGLILATASLAQFPRTNVVPVVIDYFYEAGCPDCFRVDRQIMPELRERLEGFYRLNRHDVFLESNVIRLAAYQEKLGIRTNEPVCIVVDYRHVFNGFNAIKAGLFDRIDECIAGRLAPGWTPPQPIAGTEFDASDTSLLERRIRSFTLPMALFNGLLDGLNPCAIATLVFLMSLLIALRVRGTALLLAGLAFCLASFAAYTAIGFGLLHVLYSFGGFPLLQKAVEAGMTAVLFLLSYLSFRDAIRYNRTQNAGDIVLRLPERVKRKIHEVLRRGVGARGAGNTELGTGTDEIGDSGRASWTAWRLATGAFAAGALVTLLESICTGQIYVPTLVVLIRTGKEIRRAWGYLLLYNIMFLIPLIVAFGLVYFGLKTPTLIEWSRREVVAVKVVTGLLFAGMAAVILFL